MHRPGVDGEPKMLRGLDRFDARSVEDATRRFWAARGLPPVSGVLGPPTAPRVHQLFGALSREESALGLLQRAVAADVDAKYLAQAGRRSSGQLFLRHRADSDTVGTPTRELVREIGIWIGGGRLETVGPSTSSDRLPALVDRLASLGILVSREAPFRSCPRCRVPRTPAGIVYETTDGPAFLVRFPLRDTAPRASLLVWVDSLWKLLGTTGLLVHPEQRYVTARYRRHGTEERVILARTSIDRLREWLPGADIEVVDEAPGASFADRHYDHPLAHDAPGLGAIGEPAGVVHPSFEVTDTGTGIVTLVPSHGAGDASVGRSLGVAGWPVLDRDLTLSTAFAHKYQGLSIDAADAFIQRDLTDGGYLFAQLTVRRGVPHCAVCGEGLVWETGRAWCLEPGQLSTERVELLVRLLPQEPAPAPTETIPWPASERELTDDPTVPELLDCRACGRLAPVADGPACPCGGTRSPVRRRLLPVVQETLVAWDRESPFPTGEGLRLYVADRRKLPAVIHHLVAIEAAGAAPGDVRLMPLPTLVADAEAPAPGPQEPLDAIRSMLVGIGSTPRAGATTLSDRRVAEARRLRKIWTVVQELLAAMIRDGFTEVRPIGARLAELTPEDRAFLSRFERLRVDVLRQYDLGHLAVAQSRLGRFFDDELREGYLPLIRRRLAAEGLGPEKVAAYAVLGHVLLAWAELMAPIAPFTGEAIHRAFRGDGESVFERPHTPIVEAALDPRGEQAYARWRSVSRALDRARHHLGLPPAAPLDEVVLFVRDETAASALRAEATTLARIANVATLDVTSPREPWGGKRLEAVPTLPAIQKVFGTATPRVVRLLNGLPGHRVREGIRSHSLQVAVEGAPVEILPDMVEFIESLPEGIVPIPWELGEMYIRRPDGAARPQEGDAPALTPDGYRLLRRVRHRLRRAGGGAPAPRIVVHATGALAEEIERQAPALVRYLGVTGLEQAASPDGFPPAETILGRAGRGERWAVWIPGVPAPPRRFKGRRARDRSTPARRPEIDGAAGDVLAAPVLEREAAIGRWVQVLDVAIGRPLVGPAKLRYAWEMGLRSYEELTQAPFEELAAIPGFGPYVAGAIFHATGREVPPAPRRSRAVPRAAHRIPTPRPSPAAPTEPLHASPPPPSELGSGVERDPVPESAPETEARTNAPADPGTGGEVGSGAPVGAASGPGPTAEVGPGPLPDVSDPRAPEEDRPEVVSVPGFGLPDPRTEEGAPDDSAPASGGELEPSPLPVDRPDPIPEGTPAEPVAIGSRSPSDPVAEGPTAPAPEGAAPPEVSGRAATPESPDAPSALASATDPLPATGSVGGPEVAPEPSASAPTNDVPREEHVDPRAGVEGGALAPFPDGPDPESRGGTPRPLPSGPEPPTGPEVDLGGPTGVAVTPGPVEVPPDRAPTAPDEPPPAPEVERAPPVVPPPPTGLRVFGDAATGAAWATFLDATAAGHRGLCLSREFPDRLKALLGPRDVTVVWLSNVSRPGTASPGNLEGLRARVADAVTTERVSAVYLDNVEVLLRVHGIDPVVAFLHDLDALARAHNIRVWVPVNPELASEADARRLVAEFPPTPGTE